MFTRGPRHLRCSNGSVLLEYLAWQAPCGTLPPVLLVPGMAASAAYWQGTVSLIDELRGRGDRSVVAISLRGRGQSGCPATGWSPEDHHADLLAVMAAENMTSCHLVGHSVGGAYALGLALRCPSKVASVTIGDFPPALPAFGHAWASRLAAWPSKDFDPAFPWRLVDESRGIDYGPELINLAAPLLVLRSTEPGGLLGRDAALQYRRAAGATVVDIDAGHDVFAAATARSACVDHVLRADRTPGTRGAPAAG